jgi:hypothetical protein
MEKPMNSKLTEQIELLVERSNQLEELMSKNSNEESFAALEVELNCIEQHIDFLQELKDDLNYLE